MLSFEQAKHIFENYLTQKGLSRTPVRYSILERVYAMTAPFSASMLFREMADTFRVTRMSVYNNLELLVTMGLVTRFINEGNGVAMFERSDVVSHSHHVVICSVCGKTREFTDARLRNTIELRNFKGFKAHRHTISVYGICSNCAKKQKIKKHGRCTTRTSMGRRRKRENS